MGKNIYSKLNKIKLELLSSNLKKSGYNKFNNFYYYELADILPTIVSLCDKHGVYTRISFTNELATLDAINVDNPNEIVTVTSPMCKLNTISQEGKQKMNDIQAIGSVETYSRRYLYLTMFSIVEADSFDGTVGQPVEQEVTPQSFMPKQNTVNNQQNTNFKKTVYDINLDCEVTVGDTIGININGYQCNYKLCYNKAQDSYFYVLSDECMQLAAQGLVDKYLTANVK